MRSKTLLKLIDEAIVPAVILVATKIVSIILVSSYLKLNWEFTKSGITFYNKEDFVTANSISSIFMYGVIFSILIWIIFQSQVLCESRVKPKTVNFLVSQGLYNLVISTVDIYSRGLIWFSYAVLTSTILFFQYQSGLVNLFVVSISGVLTILAGAFLFFDLEKELGYFFSNRS